jgi:putative sterol carrier protein
MEATPESWDLGTDALARMIRSLPEDQLAAGVRANREPLLEEVFRRFPERVSEAGRRTEAVLKWRLGGRDGGGYDRWFVVLRDGACEVVKDLDVVPRVTLTLDALDFLKLVTGNASPIKLLATGRLRVRGDLIFAARIPGLFRAPRGA